jgi:hypothetical protein
MRLFVRLSFFCSYIAEQNMFHGDSASFKDSVRQRCPCRACENHRRYQQMHPKKHYAHVKAYYNRNQEKILMQKAYKRFLEGSTKRFHRQTLIRLANAGFDISPFQTATIDHAGTLVHTLTPFAGIKES